jgi:4'-phosphopantetheinyl transferase
MLSLRDITFPQNALGLDRLKREVHIWSVSLQQSPEHLVDLVRCLSDDELSRVASFYFERDRRCFIVARSILRAILGRYLNCAPHELQFRYGHHGKPYLDKKDNPHSLRFNVSHSHEFALYALTCDREIGVDLEYVQPLQDIEQIAANYFSKNEYDRLMALPDNRKTERFFTYWTCKEAYIKALGDGLSRPLDQFEIEIKTGRQYNLIVYDQPEETKRWTILRLKPAAGYLAALAVEGTDFKLKRGQWETQMS